MMIALTVLMLVYLHAWVRRRYGDRLAWMAALLFAANPVLLAHAGLMTTDMPITLATLFALLQAHDYLQSASPWRLAGLALAVAGLLTAKLTGIVVAILLFVPAVGFAALGRGRFAGLTKARRAARLGRDAVVVALVGLLAINAVYRFDDTGLTVAEIAEHEVPPGKKLRRLDAKTSSLIRALPHGVPIPVPYTYLYSVEYIRAHNRKGHGSYFLGKNRARGTPG